MAVACPKYPLQEKGFSCGKCCTKIENLQVTRGKSVILDGINLHIHCGELVALIGPNGAGKSTLLKALIGEIPYRGRVSFQNSLGRRKAVPTIGYVPQRWDFDFGSPVSVCDLFIASQRIMPVWLAGRKKMRGKISESLRRVQAEHLIDRRLGELSGGEIQRILLALAMEPIPELLLLDEPVSGVDFNGRQMFYRTVSRLRSDYDLSVILVSHDLELVSRYADRMILLNKCVQCVGTPKQVMEDEKVKCIFGRVLPKLMDQEMRPSYIEEGSM
ncbi:MAG: metal ABC transporter ATP-binding protein [Desulfitobacteriaceae bacterium]|nr:metal ABC transporter ATP-binding protein [Desulfitobacteriaceae bacterium]MDD4751926.1 metal ABC transporter ATP-binding protein [Desulfitobacteriaceae bacterium]